MELIIEDKPLTPVEQTRLSALESIIRENFLAYVAVGNALMEIREKRLYRTSDGRTWEGYCREIWDMGYKYADRLVAASKVIENLTPIGAKEDGSIDWERMPANESQARELSRLEPEEQKQVWQQLIETKQPSTPEEAPFKVTAKTVKNAVKSFKGEQLSDSIRQAGEQAKPRTHAKTSRQSAEFTQAWEGFLKQVEIEHNSGWKYTSRETLFATLNNLARRVGECGEQNIREQKILWRSNNLEKLLASGFGIFRLMDKIRIEQMETAGTWLVYGEYETEAQAEEVFRDLLLEPSNLQA